MRDIGYEIGVLFILFILLCFAVRTKSAPRFAMWLTHQCSKVNADFVWYTLILSPFILFEASIRAVHLVGP